MSDTNNSENRQTDRPVVLSAVNQVLWAANVQDLRDVDITAPRWQLRETESGYEVVRTAESLIREESGDPTAPGWRPPIANSGLIHTIRDKLAAAGRDLQVDGCQPRRVHALEFPQHLDAVSWDYFFLGLLVYPFNFLVQFDPRSVDAVSCIIQAGITMPNARIAVLASTNEEAARIAEYIRRWIPDTLSYHHEIEPQRIARVLVGTVGGLGRIGGAARECDHLFVPDARQTIREPNQILLQGWESWFRIVGFLPSQTQLSAYQRARLGALFGRRCILIPAHGMFERPVQVAWCRLDAPIATDVGELRPLDAKREGYWYYHARNRRVVQLATDLMDGSIRSADRICPGLSAHLAISGPASVVVLVETIEHALALARLLPGHSIQCASPICDRGLNRTDRKILRKRVTMWPSTIATVDALPMMHSADVVIWAGGGPGIPQLSEARLFVQQGSDRPLTLIDVRDNHYPLLSRWSRQRERAYRQAGYYRLGQIPRDWWLRPFWRPDDRRCSE